MIPCVLATLYDPGGTCASLPNVCALLPAADDYRIGFRFYGNEAQSLHAFALRLSHFFGYA